MSQEPASHAVRIRPASPCDAGAIAGVQRRSRVAAYRGLVPSEWLDLTAEEAAEHESRWDAALSMEDEPRVRVWVAEIGGTPVGFVVVGPSEDEPGVTGSVEAIYVDPPHWRRGVGTALLAEATAALAREGFSTATLWTYETSREARAFYEAHGWRPDGAARPHPDPRAPRQLRYRRPLVSQRAGEGAGL